MIQYVDVVGNAYRERDARGPRWFVSGHASASRCAYALADTEAEAVQAAEKLRSRGLRAVNTYPPDGEVSPETVASRLRKAREAVDEATAVARAMALRLAEAGIAETTTATTLGVDRMTVRKWLGKR